MLIIKVSSMSMTRPSRMSFVAVPNVKKSLVKLFASINRTKKKHVVCDLGTKQRRAIYSNLISNRPEWTRTT